MARSRLHNTMLNSSIATIAQGASLVLKFTTQTIFIKVLGAQYLGINSLFLNIMFFLALLEFGIGSAIVYALYDPLAHEDRQQITALTQLFRKIYRLLGVISLLIGGLILLLIPTLTTHSQLIAHWQLAYGLILANYLLFFLNEDKRQLLIADQLSYVSVRNQCLFLLLQTVLQALCLWFTSSYLGFLLIQLLCTLVSNQLIHWHVRRRYPYLKDAPPIPVTASTLATIKKNVHGLIGSKLSNVMTTTKDGLLIALLLNVTLGGIYANYTMIISGIYLMLIQLTGSVTASIGNLKALSTANDEHAAIKVIQLHYFINFVCTFFCSIFLFTLLNPFITLWIGPTYTLPRSIVLVIVLNFSFNQMRQTSIAFINAYGLFWKFGLKSLIETVISVGSSLLLAGGFGWGIGGILLGTLISHVALNLWWEPRLVFRDGLRSSIRGYVNQSIYYYATLLLTLLGLFLLPQHLLSNPIVNLLLLFTGTLGLGVVLLLILFHRTTEFKNARQLLINIGWMLYRQLKRPKKTSIKND